MATNIQKIRLLIGDTDTTPKFRDGQLDVFLDFANDVIYIAAALALESWAATLAGSAESETIGGYSYSKKESDKKLALAKHYRAIQAELDAAAETTPSMTWAEMNLTSVGETLEEE